MYHLKKKFTKKVKRRTSRVNKKYNRKRVTKKIKLSRKKLNKKNKKNKRRRRSVKRGGELNEDNIPPSHSMAGGDDGLNDTEEPGQYGGLKLPEFMAGGNQDEEEPAVGGNSNDEEQIIGGKMIRHRGGNGCPCGVV